MGSFFKVFSQVEQPGKNSLVFVPFPFYYPETRFGVACGALYTFRFKGIPENQRPSQIQAGGGYTQNRQVLSYINSQLYTKDLGYSVTFELGYYRYFYPFSGVGNSYPDDQLEIYSVNFPRLRSTVLKRVTPHFFVGPRLFYDGYDIIKTEAGKLLESGAVTGSRGGVNFAPGIAATYDTRDNYFSARKGALIELGFMHSTRQLLSDYKYNRYFIQGSKYFPLTEKLVLAGNFMVDAYYGNPPFYSMASLGGPKILRGFYDARFRDKKALVLQGEARWMFWKRLGVAGFAGAGEVGDSFRDFNRLYLRWTAGGGLRIVLNEKERLYARLDYGYTSLGYGNLYFTFFEAF